MSIFLAILFGLIQGLTEFLPVSSSGHLMLFQRIFGLSDNLLFFNIILHIATLCAVLVVFRKKIGTLIRHPFNKTNLFLIVATAITCLLVIIFKDAIDKVFNYKILPVTFTLTAVILFLTTVIKPKQRPMSYITAITLGMAQGIAILPGLSRSGTTMATGLMSGMDKNGAAEFSFLMSIPIILASLVYELMGNAESVQIQVIPTAIAFAVALLSGIAAIKFMLKIIQKVKIHWFGLYLVILAVICLFL